MAAKVRTSIGSEITTTFCFSVTKTTTSIRSSNATVLTKRSKQGIGVGHFVRPPLAPVVKAASDPSGPNSNEPDSSFPSTFQDNLTYLLKLAISSVLGAAFIKYGSAAVPDITRPNITVALSMILTPPVLAVLLLAKQSQED